MIFLFKQVMFRFHVSFPVTYIYYIYVANLVKWEENLMVKILGQFDGLVRKIVQCLVGNIMGPAFFFWGGV